MCHPMGEEKLWAHRVFVSFARDLAAAGFAVVRFDFRGEGDSDRAFEDADLETRIQDTCLILDTVKELNPSVSDIALLGLRLGAAVAVATATRRADVSRLILWDPVIDGASYIQTVLRWNLMFQMAQHRKVVETRDALVTRMASGSTVNIEGYELGDAMFQQVSAFQLATRLEQFPEPALIVQITQGETELNPVFAALAARSSRLRADIVKEEIFWRETKVFLQRSPGLTAATVDWLNTTFA